MNGKEDNNTEDFFAKKLTYYPNLLLVILSASTNYKSIKKWNPFCIFVYNT